MSGPCAKGFPEELLSGYLDHELTQADEQRARLHLEDCPDCKAVLGDLQILREAAMTTNFSEPNPTEWGELPRGRASAAFRSLGWIVVVIWLAAVVGYAAWELATGPERLAVKLLTFGGISGVSLLLISVLIDRVRTARTDRYTGVER